MAKQKKHSNQVFLEWDTVSQRNLGASHPRRPGPNDVFCFRWIQSQPGTREKAPSKKEVNILVIWALQVIAPGGVKNHAV